MSAPITQTRKILYVPYNRGEVSLDEIGFEDLDHAYASRTAAWQDGKGCDVFEIMVDISRVARIDRGGNDLEVQFPTDGHPR